MVELKKVNLGDIITFKNGKKKPAEEGTIPIYGGNGILGYTDRSNYKNCIAVGRVGAYCGSVYYEPGECWISDNAIAATPKADVDIYFAFYLLKSLNLNQRHIGTSQPLLTQEILNKIECQIPDLDIQKKISNILRTVDGKVECNTAINRNLSEQAQTMVHEWEETEKDNIEYKTVADVAELNPDTYSPKEEWDFVNYLDTSSITEGTISELTYIIPSTEKLPSRARRKLIADDIVYSTVRPNQKHYGYINQPEQNMLASTGFVVVRANKKLVSSQLLYLLITRDIVTEKMQQIAEGSTSTFPSIKPSDLGTYEIPVPKAGFRTNLIDGLDYIFKCMYSNQQENRRLADLRDCLLPKLMSGKLDVSDLEI